MMMLQNQDEIRKFDAGVVALLQKNPADVPGIVVAVGKLMRELCGHDWPEWAAGHGWSVHESEFDNVDYDDAEFMKRFVTSAITVLKSDGSKGLSQLRKSAEDYLQQRGVIGSVSPDGQSKPLRFNTWHKLFVAAKYSENESERSFRDWLKEQLSSGNAYRNTERGPITFDREFLSQHNVTVPE